MRTRHVVRIVTTAAVALGAFCYRVPGSSAKTTAEATFIGSIQLTDCPGLGFMLTAEGGGLDLSKTPQPDVEDPGGNRCNFEMNSAFCVDDVVNADKGSKPATVNGTDCELHAVGALSGFCGLSAGRGTGDFVDSTGNRLEFNFAFLSVDSEVVVRAGIPGDPVSGTYARKGSQTGTLKAVLDTLPPIPIATPNGGSCNTKSARYFTIGGNVTFALT